MRSALRLIALLLIAGCGEPHSDGCIADCGGGVQLAGRFYTTIGYQQADETPLGPPVATIVDQLRCECGHPEQPTAGPGEALGMYVHGKVYAVQCYRSSVRVATVERHGRVVRLHQFTSGRIRHGRDMLDLSGRVVRITVPRGGGKSMIITDPKRVGRVVRAVNASPVVKPKWSTHPVDVRLRLRSGSVLRMELDNSGRRLDHGLLLSPDLVRALSPH